MEQVFGLVNIVLERDRQTRKRSLNVRDYKVIPLASQAGVLEFVGNTVPLLQWLHIGHVKYVYFRLILSRSLRLLDIDQVI
jgi:ataxia telangiectasia mutated family protein